MRLGIDFGTTNSSVAYFDGQTLSRLTLDPSNDNPHVLPSLIYIDREHQVATGTAAARSYLEQETGRPVRWEKRRVGEIDFVGAELSYVQVVHVMVDTAAHGRLLQYVKTALRDPRYEGTQVFDRFYTVDELVSLILSALKVKAEQAFGEPSREVVIGRPVRFSDDAAVTARAEEILFKAARRAGFESIRFALEPIGAAYHYHDSARERQTAFIFDFGGGTLDLTVAELGGKSEPKVLATHGVLVGGDDLDRRIMQSLRPYFAGARGNGKRVLPDYLLEMLDNWQTMPLLSRTQTLKTLDEYRAAGVDPRAVAALKTLVTRNIGFKLFREIEQTKKRLSDKHGASLDLEYEDLNIHEFITRKQFEGMIQEETERVEKGVRQALDQAGVSPSQIDVVLRTGGTSAVPVFAALLAGIFGEDKLAEMDLLTSVVGGLAVIAHRGEGSDTPYPARYDINGVIEPGSIRVKSSKPYERYEFRVGANCYRDKAYSLRRVPVELTGLPAIRTAQEDKNAANKIFMQFDLARPARVHVGYDASAQALPEWLRPFKDCGRQIKVDQWGTDRYLNLYAQDFSPGRVTLGGNCAPGKRGDIFMQYIVVVKAL